MPQILNLEEYEKQPKQTSICNYGPGKKGKTFCLSTLLYLDKRIDIIDLDYGVDPLFIEAKKQNKGHLVRAYRFGKTKKRAFSQQKPDRETGHNIILDVMSHINKYYDLVDSKKWDSEGPGIIVIDSMTVLNSLIFDFIIKKSGKEIGDSNTDARTWFWQQQQKLLELIEGLKELPCISIFNFHENREKDDLLGFIRVDPLCTGKQSYVIASVFGIVVYSDVQNGKYVWRVMPSTQVSSAGSRFTKGLPDYIPQDYAILLGDKEVPKENKK